MLNKAISGYSLANALGINQSTISRIRNPDKKNGIEFDNITIGNIMKIQQWIDDGNFAFSYDYEELIHEFREDISEGLLSEYCYIVRGEWIEALEYAPIIDYYYDLRDVDMDAETVQKIRTDVALREMEKWNEIG